MRFATCTVVWWLVVLEVPVITLFWMPRGFILVSVAPYMPLHSYVLFDTMWAYTYFWHLLALLNLNWMKLVSKSIFMNDIRTPAGLIMEKLSPRSISKLTVSTSLMANWWWCDTDKDLVSSTTTLTAISVPSWPAASVWLILANT